MGRSIILTARSGTILVRLKIENEALFQSLMLCCAIATNRLPYCTACKFRWRILFYRQQVSISCKNPKECPCSVVCT